MAGRRCLYSNENIQNTVFCTNNMCGWKCANDNCVDGNEQLYRLDKGVYFSGHILIEYELYLY